MKHVIVIHNDPIPLAEIGKLYTDLMPIVGEGAVVDGKLAAAFGVRFAIHSEDWTRDELEVLYARGKRTEPLLPASMLPPHVHAKEDCCMACGHAADAHNARGQAPICTATTPTANDTNLVIEGAPCTCTGFFRDSGLIPPGPEIPPHWRRT